MSSVVFLWIGSVIILLAIILFAMIRRTNILTEMTFADLLRGEIYDVLASLRVLSRDVLTKGSMLIISGVDPLRRGNELVMERLLGMVQLKRGRSSSFFLKRIAEHKDIIKRDGEIS